MLHRNFNSRFMAEDPGTGGGGGGGGGVTPEQVKTQVDAAVALAVEAATKPLSAKNAELLDDLKKTKDKAKSFEGLDLERLTTLQKAMDESEEAKLIADGKIDDVFSRRYSRLSEDNDTKVKAVTDKLTESEQGRELYKKKFESERLSNKALRNAEKSGVLPEAMDTIVDKIMRKFSLSEDGKEEARDENGTLIMSKDGKNPLSVKEYLEESVKVEHSYCWPSSKGAGLGGGGPGGEGFSADDKDISAAAHNAASTKNLSEYRRLRQKTK